MELTRMRLDELDRAKYNPRRSMTAKEAADLRESIESNGYLEPIVVNIRDGKNVIVSGHQRLTVMRNMGVSEAQVSVVDLDEQEEIELNVTLNRVKGEWDPRKLANLMDELESREHLGFTSREIDALLKSAESRLGEIFDGARELHELPVDCKCPHCGHEGSRKVFGSWH